MVERLFLAVPRCCLRFVIVVFPDHTHLLSSMFSYKFMFLTLTKQILLKVNVDSKCIQYMEVGSWVKVESVLLCEKH